MTVAQTVIASAVMGSIGVGYPSDNELLDSIGFSADIRDAAREAREKDRKEWSDDDKKNIALLASAVNTAKQKYDSERAFGSLAIIGECYHTGTTPKAKTGQAVRNTLATVIKTYAADMKTLRKEADASEVVLLALSLLTDEKIDEIALQMKAVRAACVAVAKPGITIGGDAGNGRFVRGTEAVKQFLRVTTSAKENDAEVAGAIYREIGGVRKLETVKVSGPTE